MRPRLCDECHLHAALPLGVGPAKLGLVEAVDALGAVLLHQAALAAAAAAGAHPAGRVASQHRLFNEHVALGPPPPPLDVFLRDDPLSPALISEVVVVVCHIWRQRGRR